MEENNHESAQEPEQTSAEDKAASHNHHGESAEEESTASEVSNDQAMAILAYLGILVIIPILVAKDSEFAMYHANQGLILFIAEVILFGIGMIPLLGWLIAGIGWIIAAVFIILGIINAAQMEKKPLPVIGGFQLLK